MNNTALIVVDMQPQFKTSCKPETLQNVAKEIVNHKECPIIFLEYKGWGRSHKHLIAIAKDPVVLPKDRDNGGPVLKDYFASYWIGPLPSIFHLVGVNTCACVSATANGLAQLYPQATIEIILDACNDMQGNVTWWDEQVIHHNDNPHSGKPANVRICKTPDAVTFA